MSAPLLSLELGEWSGSGTEDFSVVRGPGRRRDQSGRLGPLRVSGEQGGAPGAVGSRLRGGADRSVMYRRYEMTGELHGRIGIQRRAPGPPDRSVGGSNPPPWCPSAGLTRVCRAHVPRAEPPAGSGRASSPVDGCLLPGGHFFHQWERGSWTGSRWPIDAGDGLWDRLPPREGYRWWDVGAPADDPAGWTRHHPAGSLRLVFELSLLQWATRRRCLAGDTPAGHICPCGREPRSGPPVRCLRPGGWSPHSPPARAVTDEDDQEYLGKFLRRHPIHGRVAIDADRSLFEALGIGSIPAMVVIDGEGRIVAKGAHTDSVRASHLQALVAGEEVEFPRSKEAPRDRWALEESGRPAPLLVAEIRPATDPSTESTTLSSEDFYGADGLSLTYVAEMAYSGEGLRVVVEGEPPNQRYRISAKSPEGIPSVRRLLRVSLEEVFGVRSQRAEREMEVFLLEKTDSSGGEARPGGVGKAGCVRPRGLGDGVEGVDGLAREVLGRSPRPTRAR